MASRNVPLEIDDDVAEEIRSLRDEGKKWNEIGEAVDVPPGKCMLFYSYITLPKKERVKNPGAADVVRLRDEDALSWGDISIRVMLSESSCRALYEEETGTTTKGNRIGKGGRYPKGQEPEDNGTSPRAARGTTKKAGAKTTRAAKQADVDAFEGLDDADAVTKRLQGYAVRLRNGDVVNIVKVKKADLVKRAIIVTDDGGKSRTLKMDLVQAISKKKFRTTD